ncbi:hypothetical protein A11A3_16647 [Alcanivorax hongdengensis A-11-3]|uniref:Teneurin-like YD-shell domain-containing protein n=1 Tax=Alcanivorax hongdengensis A-11-3 TaxID=1177179 RepID=L0W7D6_9GAMM|nr:RHS repeat-associated core domain-containing protein [Alcanivorax hongdengensis]EKF72844.1 hypothetical protein A11A3_16647 [Alcanivorax hongdengensis A-11-3]
MLRIVLLGLLLLSAGLAQAVDEVKTIIHTDHLGSPVLGRSMDGETVFERHYAPFGASLDAPDDKLATGYTGHREMRKTGLVYAGARWYDPSLGQFLSPDPVLFRLSDPVSFNRYVYGANNPLNMIDPDGFLEIRAYKIQGRTEYSVQPADGAFESGMTSAMKKMSGAFKKVMKISDIASKSADFVAGKPASWTNKGMNWSTLMRLWHEASIDEAAINGYRESSNTDVLNGRLSRDQVSDFIDWAKKNIEGFSDYGYDSIVSDAERNVKASEERLKKYWPGAGALTRENERRHEYLN